MGKFQVHGVWLKLFLKKIPFPLGIFPQDFLVLDYLAEK